MKIARWSVGEKSQRVNKCQTFCRRLSARYSCVLKQQDGIALVLALVSIMLLSMLGLYGSVGSQTELRIASNDQLSKRTWDVADAGIRHSFHILGESTANAWSNGFSDELSNGGIGGSLGSAGGTVTTIEGKQYVFFSFGGSNAADGYYVRAEDNFDDADQTADKDQRIRIIARGQVGDAVKVIEALTVPPVKCALTANGDTLLSGNSMSSNVQVNTLDGNGACVHTNANLKIQGSVNFPDGASASGAVTACSGNPVIGSGSCDQAKASQPIQPVPTINPGQFAQYVADLGMANPSGPYYILHSRGDYSVSAGLGSNANKITKGGQCKITDGATLPGASPATTYVGQCKNGIVVTGTELTNIGGATVLAAPLMVGGGSFVIAAAGGGGGGGGGGSGPSINLSTVGTCKVSGLLAGVYYCDGKFDVQGQISANVILIARDNIEMGSQYDAIAYLPNSGALTAITSHVNLDSTIAALSGGITEYRTKMGLDGSYDQAKITAAGNAAYGNLSNFSLVSGQDIKMTGGSQVTIQGIIFAHNEIYMTGNKNITGFVMAGSGNPTFPGDPHPPSLVGAAGDSISIDTLTGNVVLNYRPFATVFPLGAPAMIAWHDNMPKN